MFANDFSKEMCAGGSKEIESTRKQVLYEKILENAWWGSK
jgi:hypothetical protein